MTIVVQLPEQLAVEQPIRFATGGMAELYRAHRHYFHGGKADLVVKHMFADYNDDPTLVARFRDEARLGLQLRHSNVVTTLEYHLVDDHHYMVMEYLEGVDLAEILRRCNLLGERLPQAVVASFLFGMASALNYLADARDAEGQPLNLVHRDISPSNVLVTDTGTVKLIDFGVARAAEREARTETGALVGKYMYMSPELIQGQDLDTRSDLFALGAVAYELLAGERAFAGASEFETCDRILNVDPRPLLDLRPDAHPLLADLVARCLAKDPADRYPHPREAVQQLYNYMHAEVEQPLPLLTTRFLEQLEERWIEAKKSGDLGRVPVGRDTSTMPLKPPPTGVREPSPKVAKLSRPPDSSSLKTHERDRDEPSVDEEDRVTQVGMPRYEMPPRDVRTEALPRPSRDDEPDEDEEAETLEETVDDEPAPVAAPTRPESEPAPATSGPISLDEEPSLDDDVAEWTRHRRRWLVIGAGTSVAALLLLLVGVVVVPLLRGAGSSTGGTGRVVAERNGDLVGEGVDGHEDPDTGDAAAGGHEGTGTSGNVTGGAAGSIDRGQDADHGRHGSLAEDRSSGGAGDGAGRTDDRTTGTGDSGRTIGDGPDAFLDIQSSPWADVYLDGERIGRTPIRDRAIPSGSHTLRYVNSENGWSDSETVELAPGEVLERRIHARP